MHEDLDRCVRILKNAGCSAKVIAHSRAVCACAIEYAEKDPLVNRRQVITGAMLHDIGRGTTHSIRHGQVGADLVRSMGLREPVARIIERHTGAGLTPDECTLLGLLPRNCMPETTEEKIVTHADNLIAGKSRVGIAESLMSAIHLKKRIRKRMYRLALDVELLCS
jgi:uncharacterized protein